MPSESDTADELGNSRGLEVFEKTVLDDEDPATITLKGNVSGHVQRVGSSAQFDDDADTDNDNEDDSSNEDDRIEADQVDGPPGSIADSSREYTPAGDNKRISDIKIGYPASSGGNEVTLTKEGHIKETGGEGEVDINTIVDEAAGKADNEHPLNEGSDDKNNSKESNSASSEKSARNSTTGSSYVDDKKPPATKSRRLVITKKKMDVIDHKLPNTKVASKLADYFKAPSPARCAKEDKEESENKIAKNIKNIAAASKKRNNSNSKADNSNRASSLERNSGGGSNINMGNKKQLDENEENSKNRKKSQEKVEKPKPPVIKRTPPKSKWGDIMSQIDNSKSAKPKPKSEIKSSLAAYLNSPLPTTPAAGSTDAIVNTLNGVVVEGGGSGGTPMPAPRKEFKSRHKPLPPPPPKIDLSKVKSKLSFPTAASVKKKVSKRDPSPASSSTTNTGLRDRTLASESVRSSRSDLSTATSVGDQGQADGGEYHTCRLFATE